MVTSIHQVKVSPTEGGDPGWTAVCQKPGCRFRIHRAHRDDADYAALEHQRSKVTPDPADQVNDLDFAEWVS